MSINTQTLIDTARRQARFSDSGGLLVALADDLEKEAGDRVHAEEALRRGFTPDLQEEPEHYEDTLKVTANIDTIGMISLTLPIRLADESGSPAVARAFNLAQNIVDAALELAAEDEADDCGYKGGGPCHCWQPLGFTTKDALV